MGLELDRGKTEVPGEKGQEIEGDDEELEYSELKKFQALVARANYLTQDGSDIQYSTKEMARLMARPTGEGLRRLKKMAKYLSPKTRSRYLYEYQDMSDKLEVWTDTDYAGCKKTRKSTSGGVVKWGKHTIKTWSSTQSVIALSSGEAEYYGMVKGASVGLGIQAVLKDFGIQVGITLKSDATAAIAIASRRGLGKVRHIEVCQLWLQDQVKRNKISVVKVSTDENIADALTKYVSKEIMRKHLENTGQHIVGGRHELAPARENN